MADESAPPDELPESAPPDEDAESAPPDEDAESAASDELFESAAPASGSASGKTMAKLFTTRRASVSLDDSAVGQSPSRHSDASASNVEETASTTPLSARRRREASVSFDDSLGAASSDAGDDQSPSRRSSQSDQSPSRRSSQSDKSDAEASPSRSISRRESIASEYPSPDERTLAMEAKLTAERVNNSRLRAEAESRDVALARREAFRMIWNRENASFVPSAINNELEPRQSHDKGTAGEGASRCEASPDVSGAASDKLRARLERLEQKFASLDAQGRTAARVEREVLGTRSQRVDGEGGAHHSSSGGLPRVPSNSGFADPVELTLLKAQIRERDAHIQTLTRWNATLKAHAEAHVRLENQNAQRKMADAAASARRATDYIESIRKVFAMEAEHDARASKQCVLLSMLLDKEQNSALRLAVTKTDADIVQPIVWPAQPPSLAVFDMYS